MAYIALYRSQRPRRFDEVTGQTVIIKTLQNALAHDKIAHAYLFNGPRGTGKTSVAKILAKALNCKSPEGIEPCGKCPNCISFENGQFTDVFEIDAASNNGVDEIRELRDNVKYLPTSKYKIYIIDEVHMLSQGAFNALLKTLEEPPKHVIFILATTEIHKIPATILSRCQRFDFKNIDEKDIISRLKTIIKSEKISIEEEAIKEIAINAEGGMRDALSLLDQVISYSEGTITAVDVSLVSGALPHETCIKILSAIISKDTVNALLIIDELISNGKEISRVINDLLVALKNILLENNGVITDTKYNTISNKLSNEKIYFYLDVLINLQQEIKWSNQKKAYLEVAIIKMMNHMIVKQIDYNERLDVLEKEITKLKENGVKVEIPIKQISNIPLLSSREVCMVMNNMDKDRKETLRKVLLGLNKFPRADLKVTASLLSEMDFVTCSTDIALFTHKNLGVVQSCYSATSKKMILAVLNYQEKIVNDVIIIGTDDFLVLKDAYMKEYKNGNTKPIINNMDLHIYKEERKEAKTLKSSDVAIKIFGEDKVKIKE